MNLTTTEQKIAEFLNGRTGQIKGERGKFSYEVGRAIYPYPHETHNLYFYISGSDDLYHLNHFDVEEFCAIAKRQGFDFDSLEN
jgi:hypothetical protein